MFDPKIVISTPMIVWGVVSIGAIIGTTVKVVTRNHITRKEAYKYLVNKESCHSAQKIIKTEIKGLKETVCAKIDGINGKIDILIQKGE